MHFLVQNKASGRTSLVVFLLASSIGLLVLSSVTSVSSASQTGPATLPSKTFVAAPPTGAQGPDDITLLAVPGVDGGQPVIWTAFQNGIGTNGSAGKPGGPTQSTVAG